LLWPELSADRESVGRLECQGQTLAKLRHPHIVTVHDVDEVDGQFYIAMECLSGRTLAHILDAQRALPLDLAFLILGQVADALDYAHKHNVLHRNVKPSNITVEEEAGEPLRAVLTDFGLLKDWKLAETDTTHIWGTPQYMAPEVIEKKHEICRATDLYALGVVAYEMLTGSVPYGGSISDILYAHISDKEPPDASTLRPGLSPDVDDVFHKALAQDPAARFDTGVEFVSALREAAQSKPNG
jgi:serine/threonine-protein kinase